MTRLIDVDSNKPMVEVFSAITDVNYTIIELKPKSIPTTKSTSASNSGRKVDFEEKNKRLGDRGELIVLQSEINKLKTCGKRNLVKAIKQFQKKMMRQVTIYYHLMKKVMKLIDKIYRILCNTYKND